LAQGGNANELVVSLKNPQSAKAPPNPVGIWMACAAEVPLFAGLTRQERVRLHEFVVLFLQRWYSFCPFVYHKRD
jgi:Mlc titration factor MtfA (ptsG expression regulator)